MSRFSNQPGVVDARYHQHTGGALARRISTIARRRVYQLFIQTLRPGPGDRILDVGTSDDTGPDSNMLERLYPCREMLTCASLSDGQSVRAAYPGVRHVQIVAGRSLPFGRNQFDIVYSNAVLEHVGSRTEQKAFIAELCRVAPRRFLAVPNRGFPVEHHTGLPFVHYLPAKWFRWLIRGSRFDYWSLEENLNYLSASELLAIWPADARPNVAYAGIGFGPWRSNLVLWQN